MNVNDIITLITTVGFPIVACGAMGWYVKHVSDQHREDMTHEREQHADEVKATTEAINNNTLALQKLTDYIERTKVYEK